MYMAQRKLRHPLKSPMTKGWRKHTMINGYDVLNEYLLKEIPDIFAGNLPAWRYLECDYWC